VEVELTERRFELRHSSAGRSWPDNQLRPTPENRSAWGHVDTRLRDRIRARNSSAGCAGTPAGSAGSPVGDASGTQVSGKKSAANSWARIRASTSSVFTFATAIAHVLRGFDATTRATCGPSIVAIALLFVVASSRGCAAPTNRPPSSRSAADRSRSARSDFDSAHAASPDLGGRIQARVAVLGGQSATSARRSADRPGHGMPLPRAARPGAGSPAGVGWTPRRTSA
jgi:hypothetical protein